MFANGEEKILSRRGDRQARAVDPKNYTFTSSIFNKSNIPQEWEQHPLNDRKIYLESPAAKFSRSKGDFSQERFMTRTFNRKMKMQDTFTKIIPLYEHVPRSCKIPSYSHHIHPEFKKDIMGNPFSKQTRENNHKFDPIKTYNEEMLKLGTFAP